MQRNHSEVLLCTAGPSTSGQGSGTAILYDINTASSLLTLKQTFSAPHATQAVDTRGGQGGLVFSAQIDKGLLNVYSYQKDQLHMKIILPEKLTCIAVDSNGQYLAGGTQNGRIYLWEVASGIMFNSWEAHYRRIAVMKFTPDGGALATGSDDSTVSVWAIASLLDSSLSSDIPNAFYTLTDHTLPITDIVCGVGTFPRCRILTSSLDNSCKIIDLASRSLLSTFQFPHPITTLAMDMTERVFFAASRDGDVHQVNLYRRRTEQTSERGPAMEAVGGGGQGSAELIGLEEDAQKKRLLSVGDPITCMTISLTSSLLVLGTTTGHIIFFDIKSHQRTKTIDCQKGFSVHSLQMMIKPQDLMGHAIIGAAKNDSNSIPIRTVKEFQRIRDPKAREAHEVSLLLPPTAKSWLAVAGGPSQDSFLDDYRFFTNPAMSTSAVLSGPSSSTAMPAGPQASARINELERELALLKSQLSRAKELNTSLYETAMAAIIGDPKQGGTRQPGAASENWNVDSNKSSSESSSLDARPSKRGRVE
ncbi:WD40 repeat-like protein [Clavulina sp. PMI_390]|nr:WD40 repeat-like protein [Clavulina sp. PMI_390]